MAWADCYSPDWRVVTQVGAAAGTTALNDRRIVEDQPATPPTFIADSIDTGRVALRCTHGTAGQYVRLTTLSATPRYVGMKARIKLSNLTTNCPIFQSAATTATDNINVRVNASTGTVAYSFNQGSTYTNSGTSLAASTVYRVEVFIDYGTGTTHTLQVRVDGIEIINATGGAAVVTGNGASSATFGSTTVVASAVTDYSDLVTYNDPAQYGVMDDWRVFGLEPTQDGTHAVGSGAFQDAAAGALTNATTTAWTMLDDAPAAAPSSTDRVVQTVDDANAYMEVILRALPAGYGDPVLVDLCAAMFPSTTGANLSGFKLNAENGSHISAEAPIDTSVAATTLEYRKHIYQTEPDGANWAVRMVKDVPLRARVGYTTLIPANVGFCAVMAFVAVPVQLDVPDINMARTRS